MIKLNCSAIAANSTFLTIRNSPRNRGLFEGNFMLIHDPNYQGELIRKEAIAYRNLEAEKRVSQSRIYYKFTCTTEGYRAQTIKQVLDMLDLKAVSLRDYSSLFIAVNTNPTITVDSVGLKYVERLGKLTYSLPQDGYLEGGNMVYFKGLELIFWEY